MLDKRLALEVELGVPGFLTVFCAIRLAFSAWTCNWFISSFVSFIIVSPLALTPDGSLQYMDAIVFLLTLTNGDSFFGV